MRLIDNAIKEALLNRKKITRKSWADSAYAIYDFDTGYIVNWWRNPSTLYLRRYELDFDDIYADDWEIFEKHYDQIKKSDNERTKVVKEILQAIRQEYDLGMGETRIDPNEFYDLVKRFAN